MSLPVRDWTVREVQDRLRKRALSSVELIESCLDAAERAERWNPMICLTAETALSEARIADDAFDRGEDLGKLHGIPITVKDLIWSAGVETTSGSRVGRGFVPESDAEVLRRLRAEGAVLLGKTNLHEFAYGVTNANPHFGDAKNPWDPGRISGGSSGGSAVALAAGIGFGSVGTDTGGSIRIPAALCGIVGLKPTYGLVPTHGVTPLSWSLDHVGPMARSVDDVAVFLDAMLGPDGKTSAVRHRHPQPIQTARLGVLRHPFFEGLDQEVQAQVEGVADRLASHLGTSLRDVGLSEEVIAIQAAVRNTIAYPEATSYHERNLAESAEQFTP